MKYPFLLSSALGLALVCACHQEEHRSWLADAAGAEAPVSLPDPELEVPPPPFTEGAFPCSDCHDPSVPPNTRRREMKLAHTEIKLHHDEEHRWCLDCHSVEDRDKLHLANGTLVEFSESYKLCGQCHGDKYRDWKAGVHGRRSGNWDGHKKYLLCVHCHNSHAPKFQPLKPLPPPTRPAPRTSP
ncbi:MAG: hypothetical protein HZA53_05165 [Planctomycetes bacterium]|nr:hypothetical protein [Planctomycetota bacterium]